MINEYIKADVYFELQSFIHEFTFIIGDKVNNDYLDLLGAGVLDVS